MNFGGQAAESSASGLATMRYDRDPASRAAFDGSTRIARQFRPAMIFKIPVGYQDETGFHPGEPRVQKTAAAIEPEDVKTDPYQF